MVDGMELPQRPALHESFRVGDLQLFQILFTGSEREPIFWTRDPWYAAEAKPVVEKVREKVKWTHAMS